MHDALLDNVVSLIERRINVAFACGQLVCDVVAVLFIDERPAFSSFLDINHGRKLIVIDHNQINGIARSVTVCSDHYGHGLAHEDYVIRSEDSIIGHLQIGQCGRARHGADLLRHVLARVDGDDAGRGRRFAHINTRYASVSVHGAQERDVKRVRQLDIINVMA